MGLHTFKADDELWARAQAIAASRGESLSQVLRAALRRYVRRHEVTPPPPAD